MMTGSLAVALPLLCSLLFGIATLAGGAVLLTQNKERGIAIAVLAIGGLCIVATLVTAAAVFLYAVIGLRNM